MRLCLHCRQFEKFWSQKNSFIKNLRNLWRNLRLKVRKIAKFWVRIRTKILREFTALMQYQVTTMHTSTAVTVVHSESRYSRCKADLYCERRSSRISHAFDENYRDCF